MQLNKTIYFSNHCFIRIPYTHQKVNRQISAIKCRNLSIYFTEKKEYNKKYKNKYL